MIQKISMKDVCFGPKVVQSLKDTGFAIVTDHGLSKELIDDVYDYWTMFYQSPDDFKLKFKYNPAENLQGGFFPFKSENAKDYKVGDLKEFYHFYRSGNLPIPPVEILGKFDVVNIRASPLNVIALFNAMEAVGIKILSEINNNLPNDVWDSLSMDLETMAANSPATLFRSIYYPPIKDNDAAEGAVRAAAHEDINLITLLPAATASGLEVLDTEDKWHSVDTSENDLVINAGDMLQLASRGYLKSTTHRVVNTEEGRVAARFSMPLFIHPWPEVRLSPTKTAAQYLDERLEEIGLKPKK